MKKFISLLGILAILLCCFVIPVAALEKSDIEISARHALLVNLDTDTVVYENDGYSQCYPASLTKIMTAIVALENTEDLDAVEITARAALFKEFEGVPISTANIKSGETFSMRELLYALMLNSACEAANIIADHVGGGSIAAFIDMMNRKATELGAVNTHFSNPHGLFDEQNYSTAYDMYLITDYALSLPDFLPIACAKTYTIEGNSNRGEKRLVHTNRMLFSTDAQFGKYYMPQVKGIKTGTLSAAGRCLITYAEHNGCRYICVVIGGDYSDSASRYKTTYNLYNWAFENLTLKTLAEDTVPIAQVKVNFAKDEDVVSVRPGRSVTGIVETDLDPTDIVLTTDLPSSVDAPIKAGDILGNCVITVKGKEVATVELIAMQDIAEQSALVTVANAVFSHPLVWVILVGIVGLFILSAIAKAKHKRRRRRRRLY
ncbi:MAG: D-alanyl-D-alanine carboxypeptidase [Clostridia bacterium]|nr:D-alanyl-D-alanine carboxypeptidase [Clostridia bacterium]